MKKSITDVISELKDIAVEIEKDPNIDTTLEKAEKDEKKSKKAPKAKEEESEEGGSEGKIKENKPLDAEETSLGKPKKEIPGAKEIVHFNDKSDLAKEEIAKDDKPHAPNTPEDKAHDVAEEGEDMPNALKILNNLERSRMLQHLRSLKDKSQQRSPENQALGKKEDGASAYLDCKKEFKKAWASEKSKKKAPSDKTEMKKMGAPAPKQDAGRAPASWASTQTAPSTPAWQTPQSGAHAGMNPAQRAQSTVMGKAKMDEGKAPEAKQEARRERNLRVAMPKAGGKEKMEGQPKETDPLATKLRLRKEELGKGSAVPAPAPAPAPKPSVKKPSAKKPSMPKPQQPTMQMAEMDKAKMDEGYSDSNKRVLRGVRHVANASSKDPLRENAANRLHVSTPERAKSGHKEVVANLAKQPKPNLPKTEKAEKSKMKKTELPTYEEFKKAFQKKLKAIKE